MGKNDGTQRLAERQTEIERSFNLWSEKIPQMMEMLRSDPGRVELLKGARRMSDEMRIRPRMEGLVEFLKTESFSKADESIKSLISDLKKILQSLESENRSRQIQNEKERLRAHLKELNERIRNQQSLQGRTRQTRDVQELAKEQDANAEKTGELARKITDEEEIPQESRPKSEGTPENPDSPESPEKSEVPQTPEKPETPEKSQNSEASPESKPSDSLSDSLRRAQQRMDEARKNLENSQRQGALEQQKKALEELEEAKAQLEQILRQMREEESKRTLAQFETQLKTMIQLQRGVEDDTKRLDGIPNEKRTQEFMDETTRLSRREKEIGMKAETLLVLLREDGRARMVAEVLSETVEDIQRTTNLLANGRADSVTLAIEKDILESLEEMLAAVEETERKLQEENDENSSESEAQTDEDPALIDKIAELRMIRSAQSRINRRTKMVGDLISEETTSVPEHLEVLQDLSRQQERIRKIVHDIAVEKE